MIHGAAFYFAYTSRDKKSIASRFGVTERTIERWSKEPDWHQALNAWGYTGERTFARVDRDIASTSRERFEQTKAIYIKEFKSGEPLHRLATITGKATGLPPLTIRRWANRYNWKAYLEEDEIAYRESTEFIGVSKTKYAFEAHILGTEFPDIEAVYIFIKRTQIGNEFINKPLYIGEADELVGRFCDRINIIINNQAATTKIKQIFSNPNDFEVNGKYIFPVPDDVALTTFALSLEERKYTHSRTQFDNIKSYGDKSFYLHGKLWVDSKYDGQSETKIIEFGSDAYFDLARKSNELAKCLKLSQSMIICHNGVNYEITPRRSEHS